MNHSTITMRAGLTLLTATLVLVTLVVLPLGLRAQQPSHSCELHARWSLCAWAGQSGMPVDVAFGDVADRVIVVYAWDGASQSWRAHFPGAAGIPGANDFDTLTGNTAYFIGISDGASVTWEQSTDMPVPTATPTSVATSTPTATPTTVSGADGFTVHYIDVGQGDATLITVDGQRMLIDGGPSQDRIEERLTALGVTSIDIVVATHADADHIAGLIRVLDLYDVGQVYVNGADHDTQTYDNFVAAKAASGATVTAVERGDSIALGGLELDVLHPAGLTGNSNADSVVLSLTCGTVGVLLTGDATTASEASMLGAGVLSQTTVLHVGHHGSNTSTGQAFVDVVQPDYAVISAGLNSQFGHPHEDVVARLTGVGATLYHTDTTEGDDTIAMTSDCNTVSFDTAPWSPDVTPATATPTTAATATATQPTGCVNLNTASFEELQQIHQVGPDRAQQIINLRPFASVDGLINVVGIGETLLQQIKDQGLACV